MIRSFIILLCFLTAVLDSQDIIDIESLIQKAKPGKNKYNLSLGGSFLTGNTEKSSFSASALMLRPIGDIQSLALAQTNYGESGQKVDTRNSLAHLRFIGPLVGNFLFWENYYQVQSDTFRRLSLRALGGVGLRWKILSNEDVRLYFGTSVFYSEEDQQEVSGFSDQGLKVYLRNSNYIALNYDLNDNIEVFLIGYFQPLIDQIYDHRLSTKFGITTKLSENLKFNYLISVGHDNDPPQGVKPTDVTQTVSLSYSIN